MNAITQQHRIVLKPETGFEAIDSVLSGIGYRREPDTAITQPMIAGEPEMAHWHSGIDDGLVNYSFNPVVFLRVLVFAGSQAIAVQNRVRDQLGALSLSDLGQLLQSADHKNVLLGLYACAELQAVGLLGVVNALRVHSNQRISKTTAQVTEKLSLALVELGAETLAEEQRRHPDRPAVFPRLGDAEERRDILRWLLHDADGKNPEVVKVVRTGLSDSDWRVRITAMLVAARMGLRELWQDIRRMELPQAGKSRLNYRWRSLLGALHKAVLAELSDDVRPEAVDQKSGFMRHLRHVVSGEDDGNHDQAHHWVNDWVRSPDGSADDSSESAPWVESR